MHSHFLDGQAELFVWFLWVWSLFTRTTCCLWSSNIMLNWVIVNFVSETWPVKS
uniref:GABA transporter 1-like n=1 Tax=Rhizophora mucronata TaxID=61149 RepID=A0A2P2LW36_RHIMU